MRGSIKRASIVEVISDHLTLKKVGRNYLGLCPFHSEKTPSFTVNEEKGIFHCFVCGVGGNVFHFLMRYHRLSFSNAVKLIHTKYSLCQTELKRLGSVDDRFAHWLCEGLIIRQMAKKICWTGNRIAKYINNHWKISFHYNELKRLSSIKKE